MSLIVVVLDRDGTVASINDAGSELLGLERGEIVGQDWFARFVPERDRARTRSGFDQLVGGEVSGANEFENPIVTASGEERLVAWHNSLSTDGDGTITGTVSSGVDVTGARDSNEQIVSGRVRLARILDTAPVGIGEVAGRVFTWVSPTLCEMVGYSAGELVGRSARMLYATDEEFERVGRVKYEQIRETGSGAVDTRWVRRDGTIIDIDLRSSAVDPSDPAAGVTFTALDISRRVRTARALEDSERRFRSIFEQAAVGFAEVETTTGRFLRVNQRYCDIVGKAREEILRLTFMQITHADDLEADLENLRRLLSGDLREFSMEKRYVREDGSVVWVDLTVSSLWGAGETPSTHLAVVEDITMRRVLEEELRQAQKLEAIGQLAGGVAHDFNNILQAMLMQVELGLSAVDEAHPAARQLTGIRDGAIRAADLTRQLLAFGRRQMLRPQNVDLNLLVPELLGMIERLIGEDIDIQFTPGPGVPTVRVDPLQIEQVLINLCVNARDAMPDGGQISIATRAVDLGADEARGLSLESAGRHVQLVVADSGTGIDLEARDRIFEPFFTTKQPGKGTGLGLSTVYGIVRQHHGAVVVDSETGVGATFQVLLPAGGSGPTSEDETTEGAAPAGGTETILVAEDEKAVLELIRDILSGAGYTVVEAADGAAAVERFRRDPDAFDLAVLDVVMPELSGRGAFDRIRRIRPELPVLFASGYGGDVHPSLESIGDAAHLLRKPFSVDDLLRHVRRLLDGPDTPA